MQKTEDRGSEIFTSGTPRGNITDIKKEEVRGGGGGGGREVN